LKYLFKKKKKRKLRKRDKKGNLKRRRRAKIKILAYLVVALKRDSSFKIPQKRKRESRKIIK
jgi:hypothetical protein